MIAVAFERGRGPWDRAIQLWTWSRFSHCALQFSDGALVEAIAGHGVRELHHVVLRPDWWETIPLATTLGEEAAITGFCLRHLGDRYDWAGIALSQVLPLHRHARSRFFCSEFVAAALQETGRYLLGVEPAQLSPGTLYRLLKDQPCRA